MKSLHKNPEQENTAAEAMQTTEERRQEPPRSTEAPGPTTEPQEKKPLTKGQLEAREFDSGPEMAVLREKIQGLPYLAKLSSVLLNDLFYAECQTCGHNAINTLLRELRNEVWANPPSDPQGKELFDLYRFLHPLQETDAELQWRRAFESWTCTIPPAMEAPTEEQAAAEAKERLCQEIRTFFVENWPLERIRWFLDEVIKLEARIDTATVAADDAREEI